MITRKCVICGKDHEFENEIEVENPFLVDPKDVMCPECFSHIDYEFADGKGGDDDE